VIKNVLVCQARFFFSVFQAAVFGEIDIKKKKDTAN
jgi:hypothetical protein